ncbi:hypothetical protein [Bradyrhizobium sp.]|uniref:hypothetical protein n=1 Tax=Bradyrhizobium sp. TaxID=376 RepID=UPI003BAE9AB1
MRHFHVGRDGRAWATKFLQHREAVTGIENIHTFALPGFGAAAFAAFTVRLRLLRSSYAWWGKKDSNLRSHEAADLQSGRKWLKPNSCWHHQKDTAAKPAADQSSAAANETQMKFEIRPATPQSPGREPSGSRGSPHMIQINAVARLPPKNGA